MKMRFMKIFINKVLGPPPIQSPVILHLGICLRAEKYREGNKKKKNKEMGKILSMDVSCLYS